VKALTLTEPWASLVALGLKSIETRGWPTHHRGRIAIHAGKKFTGDDLDWLLMTPDAFVPLTNAGLDIDQFSPGRSFQTTRGCVIATARLIACVQFDLNMVERIGRHYGESELLFGDFSKGRYGFVLADVIRLPEPIPAVGSLGFWDWEPPAQLRDVA
jgi:hypothetical protein